MKKVLLLATLAIALFSCSSDDAALVDVQNQNGVQNPPPTPTPATCPGEWRYLEIVTMRNSAPDTIKDERTYYTRISDMPNNASNFGALPPISCGQVLTTEIQLGANFKRVIIRNADL